MVSLNLAFKACGYITKKQQMAFFQLLESYRAFDSAPMPTYQAVSNHSSNGILDYLAKDVFFNLQDAIHWLVTAVTYSHHQTAMILPVTQNLIKHARN